MAKARKAGEAFVRFTLRDDELRKRLKSLQKRFSAVGASLRKIGSIGVAVGGTITTAFGGAVKVFASMGDNLDKMSNRTGVSVELLSALGFASEQSGQDVATLEKSLSRMQRSIYDAGRGLSTPLDALEELGVRIEDLQGMNPDKQFVTLAEAISQIEDPTKKAGVVVSLFGQAGRKMIPLLNGGAAGIAGFVKEAEELGIVVGTDDATAAAEFTDALNRLWRQFKQVVFQIGGAVAGPLTQFAGMLKPIVRAVIQWAQNNRPLLATIAAVGTAIFAVGGGLTVLGGVFAAMSVAVGGFATAFGAIGTIIGAIVSPIGLVVAGIAGATAAFLKFTETGQGMVSGLMGVFGELKGTAVDAFGAIKNALAAGDIEAAGKVLWSALKLMWLQGTQGLREKWHSFVGGVAKFWHRGWAGMMALGNAIWGNIERAWSHTVEYFATGWDQAVTWIKQGFNKLSGFSAKITKDIQTAFQKAWLKIKGFFGADIAGEVDKLNAELAATNKAIDDLIAKKNKKLGQGVAERTQKRMAEGEREREQSRKLQEDTLKVIGDELEEKLKATDDGTKEKIEAARKQLEDAKDAFGKAKEAADSMGMIADKQKQAVAGIAEGLNTATGKAAGKFASSGVFNVAAIGKLLGNQDPTEQTAENTKKMLAEQKITNRHLQNQNGGGLVFS